VDHIISEKHGGRTTADKLAYACFFCNRHKGTDIATIDSASEKLIPLFNPRTDSWDAHFTAELPLIKAKTEIGEATARLLGFNLPERVLERAGLNA
jgi:5-methylcytosine-specific restriction endonuclease McrA